MISRKNIVIIAASIVLLAVIGVGYYFYQNKSVNQVQNKEGLINNQIENVAGELKKTEEIKQPDLSTKEGLLLALKESGKAEDFNNFSKYLKMIYQNQWEKDSNLEKMESEIYMDVTTKYFDSGNVNEALRISTIVYNEVPQGWRFRYLMVRCLEKIGRDAFIVNDLNKAEEYANKILQMMYRPEGANLLADVYIEKIESNIVSGNIALANDNLNFIWDYEVSEDRRAKLTELKTQLSK